MFDVVCLGTGVFDRVYRVDRLPAAEGKLLALGYHESGGGIAASAAVAAAALGGSVAWCGTVGDDETGRALRSGLVDRGVDVSAVIVRPASRSPSAAILVDRNGERLIVADPGTADALGPEQTLPDTRALLVDPHHTEAAVKALAIAAERALPCVLDGETAAPEAIAAVLARSNHAIFSRAGLAQFTGTDHVNEGLRIAARGSPGLVAVTLGAQGSLFLLEGAFHSLAAPRVAVVDTTGCGDVFHGAYALALAEGSAPLDAARFATAAAALKAQRGGGWQSMPSREETESLLRAGW
jgi:sulfofructose kinase